MGRSGSKATVLENMIKNFKKRFYGDYERKMTPGRLHTLCEVKWPSMGVGYSQPRVYVRELIGVSRLSHNYSIDCLYES